MGDETASPGRRARPSARDARKAQLRVESLHRERRGGSW